MNHDPTHPGPSRPGGSPPPPPSPRPLDPRPIVPKPSKSWLLLAAGVLIIAAAGAVWVGAWAAGGFPLGGAR